MVDVIGIWPGGLMCCLKHNSHWRKKFSSCHRTKALECFCRRPSADVTNPGSLELLQSGGACSQVCAIPAATCACVFKPLLHVGYLIKHWGLFSSSCSKWYVACFQVTLLLFWDSVLPFRSGWPGSNSVAQAGLKLTAILLGLQACVAMQVCFWTLIFLYLYLPWWRQVTKNNPLNSNPWAVCLYLFALMSPSESGRSNFGLLCI